MKMRQQGTHKREASCLPKPRTVTSNSQEIERKGGAAIVHGRIYHMTVVLVKLEYVTGPQQMIFRGQTAKRPCQ